MYLATADNLREYFLRSIWFKAAKTYYTFQSSFADLEMGEILAAEIIYGSHVTPNSGHFLHSVKSWTKK